MRGGKVLAVDFVAETALDGELDSVGKLAMAVEHTVEPSGLETEIAHRRGADGGGGRRVAGRDADLADQVAGLAFGDFLVVDHDLDETARDEAKLADDLALAGEH